MIHRVLIVLAITSMASVAHADSAAVAKEHFRKGTMMFDLQRYSEAAHEYELAFEAKDSPALLFNIAQSYRLGGDYQKAIAAYRSFLRRAPETPNRAEVEARVSEMQRLLIEQKKAAERPPSGVAPGGEPEAHPTTMPPPVETPATPPPTAAATPPAEPAVTTGHADDAGRTKRLAGIAVASVGVAALVVGAVLLPLGNSAADSINHGTGTFDPSQESTAKAEQSAGVAMLIVGGAALITGTTLVVLGVRERRAHLAIAPIVTPNLVAASVGGSF